MADNLLIVISGGTATVRTVDRSGVQTQAALLDIAQASEAELLGIGKTTGPTATSAGLTTASTAYTAGDQMGTEVTWASATRAGRGLILQSSVLVDKAKVASSIDLLIFGGATTPAADNAAHSWSDADMAKLLTTPAIHYSDRIISANNYILGATNLPMALAPPSGTSLFLDFIAAAACSFFGAVTDLVAYFGVSQD